MDVYLEDSKKRKRYNCTRFFNFIWTICSYVFTHIFLVTLVVGYCCLGSYTFSKLEEQYEKDVRSNVTYVRQNATEDLWTYTHNMSVLEEEKWKLHALTIVESFETKIIYLIKKDGWDGKDDRKKPGEEIVRQWTQNGAFFYSIIVITTIGYGHIAPKTSYGKVATIIYAIFGIPLMLLTFANIGGIMAHVFKFLYWRVFCYACTKKKQKSPARMNRRSRHSKNSHNGNKQRRAPAPGITKMGSLKMGGSKKSQISDSDIIELAEMKLHSPEVSRDRTRETILNSFYDKEVDPRETQSLHRKGQSIRRSASVKVSSRPLNRVEIEQNQHSLRPQRKNVIEGYSTYAGSPIICNRYASLEPESFHNIDENDSDQSVATIRTMRNTLPRREQRNERRSMKDQMLSPHKPPSEVNTPSDIAISQRTYDKLYNYEPEESEIEEETESNDIKPVPIWLCVFLVVGYILGGTFMFRYWENWSLEDSAYFCFITLTTIGFGDFVPSVDDPASHEIIFNSTDSSDKGQSKTNFTKLIFQQNYRIIYCSLYLLFGIALLAMSFNLVQEVVIHNIKIVAKILGIIKDDSNKDDDSETNEFNDND